MVLMMHGRGSVKKLFCSLVEWQCYDFCLDFTSSYIYFYFITDLYTSGIY